MTQATRVHSTPPLNTSAIDGPQSSGSIPDLLDLLHEGAVITIERPTANNATVPQRSCIYAAAAIIFFLLAGGVASSLVALNLESRLAHRCAVAQKAVAQ